MKKLVLLIIVILLFSCLGSIQGKAGVCPDDRPFLVDGTWRNANCPEFQISTLSEIDLPPSMHWKEISFNCVVDRCEDEKSRVLCQGLNEINENFTKLKRELGEKYEHDRERFMNEYRLTKFLVETCEKEGKECLKLRKLRKKLNDVNEKIMQLAPDILEYNSEIIEINQIIREKNDRIKTYNDRCEIKSMSFLHFHSPYIPFFLRGDCPSDLLQQLEQDLEYVIQNRLEEIENIENKIKDHQIMNLHLLLENIKKEKKDHAEIIEFEKFYTPEKEKQLLEDYEKALAEKCVGCDYPEPINIQQYDCVCPNRKYVDGKCILEKETQK